MRDEDYKNLTTQAKAAYDIIRAAGYIIHSPDVVERTATAVASIVLNQTDGNKNEMIVQMCTERVDALRRLYNHLDNILPIASSQRLLLKETAHLI